MYILADFADKEQKVNVKSYQRLRNGRLETVQAFDSTRRKRDEDQPNNTGRNLLIGAAITGGVLAAGLLAFKGATGAVRSDVVNKSDMGIDEVLKTTKSLTVNTKPLEYKDADILIAVNGINGTTKELDDYNDVAKGLDLALNNGNKKVNVIPFTIAYDLTGMDISKKPDLAGGFKTLKNLLYGEKTNTKTAELMKTVQAYQAQYPNKKITVVGFSMGGYVATNAAYKLNDPRIQTISIAAPNISKRQPPNYTAVRAKNDDVIPGIAFSGKEIVLDDADSHIGTMSSKKGFDLLYKKVYGG